jgi:hypothetical protein
MVQLLAAGPDDFVSALVNETDLIGHLFDFGHLTFERGNTALKVDREADQQDDRNR